MTKTYDVTIDGHVVTGFERAKQSEYFKNRAIKKSIRKWERICGNPCYVWMIPGECGLCNYTGHTGEELDCPRCPLHQAGHGCLEPSSTFRSIVQLLNNKSLYLNDDLFDLIEIMYENVCDLMPDYDPQLEAKND